MKYWIGRKDVGLQLQVPPSGVGKISKKKRTAGYWNFAKTFV